MWSAHKICSSHRALMATANLVRPPANTIGLIGHIIWLMAQRTIVQLVDDVDGGEASQTVKFGLDGALYEIDLSEGNAKQLREALADFIANGRKLSRSGRPYRHVQLGPASRDVRAWAKAKGYKVPERGRVPREFVDQYEKAHRR
jgi:hypothetical protein